jgi:alpha-beta hydrolase superfamily lysophospholipase
MIDLEGFGYSAGSRITNLLVERMHHQVTTILTQVSPDLPCFLLGHSMGGMVINGFLGLNPDIAAKFAGVIFSAPLFGLTKPPDFIQRKVLDFLAVNSNEAVSVGGLLLHRITRNKHFVRSITNQRKATPLVTASLFASFLRNIDQVQKNATKVEYPYLLILGEKDVIFDNASNRKWHSNTKSQVKEMKLMAGSFHELSKEPNNGIFFETVLKFAAKRVTDGAKAFGTINPKEVKFSKILQVSAAAGQPS